MPKNDETTSLFSQSEHGPKRDEPLAARMRPRRLAEYTGQAHMVGPGQLLRRAIEADRIHSLILYGPPGTGKTSLAQIIAGQTKSKFVQISGVEANVDDIRRLLATAKNRRDNGGGATIVFLDEIHRFNKSQQDVLLPDVENGVIKLIGATTHNPFFFVNAPLVSRSQIFELRPLTEGDLLGLLHCALTDNDRGLGHLKISAAVDALQHISKISDGDARKALNSLEIAALTTPPDASGVISITLEVAEQSIQQKAVVYDGDGDAHYDTASAYQKAMRGCDPDAALYWLAKMIVAGEDPRFIARRMVICAAEDVGLADPMALVVANAAKQAAEFVGWPEAQLHLAQATLYIAVAPKSNSACSSIEAAVADVRTNRTIPVPKHLRDPHYKGARRIGHGTGYEYPHNHPGNFVAQDYLGVDKIYYAPSEQGAEKQIKERVENWRKQFQEVRRQASESARFKNTFSSGSCSSCSFAHQFEDGLICVNGCVMAQNPHAGEVIKVAADHNCDCFEPRTC